MYVFFRVRVVDFFDSFLAWWRRALPSFSVVKRRIRPTTHRDPRIFVNDFFGLNFNNDTKSDQWSGLILNKPFMGEDFLIENWWPNSPHNWQLICHWQWHNNANAKSTISINTLIYLLYPVGSLMSTFFSFFLFFTLRSHMHIYSRYSWMIRSIQGITTVTLVKTPGLVMPTCSKEPRPPRAELP